MSRELTKNLEHWAEYAPKESILLPYVDESELTLKKGLLSSSKGVYPKEDITWMQAINLTKADVLAIYGVNLGESYQLLKKWLKEKDSRRLAYFEEDPRVIKHLLSTHRGSELIKDPQVELHYISSFEDKEGAFENFYWNSIGKKIVIASTPAYLEWYPSRFEEFQNKLINESSVKSSLVEEYLEYSVPFFRNFYANILELDKAHIGNKLFNQFKGCPAIITGAGPSLDKQLSKLKKIEEDVIIFSGGSSLNAVSHAGVKADFGAGVDPNSLQITRLKTNKAPLIPFFYRNRFHFEALKMIQGPRLYITGAGGYDIPNYYEEKFKIDDGFIDEGFNVINFLIEIANKMGCSPIILIGLDLAFTGNKTYAGGVVSKDSSKESEHHVLDEAHVIRQDQEGNPVVTQWKWIAEADWIARYQKEHPEVVIINATEGGLKIEGLEHSSFQEVIEKYVKQENGLKERIRKAIDKAKVKSITKEKVIKLTLEMKESLKRSLKDLEILYEEVEKRIKKYTPDQSNTSLVVEDELMEEIAYIYILDIFNAVYGRLQNKALFDLKRQKLSEKKKEIEKLKLQNERVKFLMNLSKVNIELIDWALKENR